MNQHRYNDTTIKTGPKTPAHLRRGYLNLWCVYVELRGGSQGQRCVCPFRTQLPVFLHETQQHPQAPRAIAHERTAPRSTAVMWALSVSEGLESLAAVVMDDLARFTYVEKGLLTPSKWVWKWRMLAALARLSNTRSPHFTVALAVSGRQMDCQVINQRRSFFFCFHKWKGISLFI